MTSADHQHESTREAGTGPEGSQETAAPGAPADTAGSGATDEAWVDDPGTGVGDDVEGGEDMGGASSTELVVDLEKAQQDVATLTGDLQRLQAEYVNYKRRVDRDRELVKQNATFSALSALLPVLDDIDRAREHGEVEGGFKAVADSLERIVAGLGLEKFGRPGEEFDPNLHEALMHTTSAEATGTTCQTIVHAGYRIGERVVRPARVVVVGPEAEPADAGSGVDDGEQDQQ